MSRTTRRTNKHGLSEKSLFAGNIVSKYEYKGEVRYSSFCTSILRELHVLSTGEAHIEDAKFHSDSYETMNNAPKWYRQDLNRKLRRKQKEYLTKCINRDSFDNYAEAIFVKDAAWYW